MSFMVAPAMVNPIRQHRLEKLLTQEGLAERAQLSVRTVQRAEAGTVTPSMETLEAIAEVLEVSADKLFIVHEMPEAVKAALRKIHEGMSDLAEYMYDNPEEIPKFGLNHGTYVFQPRDLPPEVHEIVCGEALPFHHAHLIESRTIRKEMGRHLETGELMIRRLCPGPMVSAVIDVDLWRSPLWKATKDFTLTDKDWQDTRIKNGIGFVEQINVKEGDRIEIVQGDHCGFSKGLFGYQTKFIRVGEGKGLEDMRTVFDHTSLPVVPMLDQEREPWKVPRELK